MRTTGEAMADHIAYLERVVAALRAELAATQAQLLRWEDGALHGPKDEAA